MAFFKAITMTQKAPKLLADEEAWLKVFKISVVIPMYNRATLVLRAISSILQQTYPVHEIIVVDDGSSDDTKEVLRRFLSSVTKVAAPVRYLYQQQQGVSVARNTGINAATGD